ARHGWPSSVRGRQVAHQFTNCAVPGLVSETPLNVINTNTAMLMPTSALVTGGRYGTTARGWSIGGAGAALAASIYFSLGQDHPFSIFLNLLPANVLVIICRDRGSAQDTVDFRATSAH